MDHRARWRPALAGAAILAAVTLAWLAPDGVGQEKQKASAWPMFGGSPARNMVNLVDKNVPTDWAVEGGKLRNVRWVAELGNRTYGGPVVAGGKVFVGTNNEKPRDPKIKGPKAVVMCFDAAGGKFLWQAVHDMPPPDVVRDALQDGMCSTPTVENGRVYYVTPACVVVCTDANTGKALWQYDLMKELKVHPAWVSNCAPLVVGEHVFVVTGNGTDEEGKLVAPDAPSFVALKKKDGKLAWKSSLPGKNVIEGQWSNPTWVTVNGKGQVVFPGGDCWLYGLEPATGELIWKFNCNPTKEKPAGRELPPYIVATPVAHEGKVYVGTGYYPDNPNAGRVGRFWCVDASKKGDVSPARDNFDPKSPATKDSALVWHYGGALMPRPKIGRPVVFGKTISTAAVHDGLAYIAEETGYLHCLDAKTGGKLWEHDFKSGVWGSPYWVDGKVYIGTEDGDIVIFAHGRQKKVLNTIYMDEAVQSTPVVADGVLYVATKTKLYAIGK